MVIEDKTNKTLEKIWNRFNCSNNEMSTVSIEEVKAFAEKLGLKVINIKEIKKGPHSPLEAIYLESDVGTALYPRQKLSEIENYIKNVKIIKNKENFWKSVDWFIPLYISQGDISRAIKEIADIDVQQYNLLDKTLLQKRFDSCLYSIYNLENIILFTAQVFANSKAISKHLPVIRESVLAFYSGMKVVAIAALIPIIENILDLIIEKENPSTKLEHVKDKVHKCIDLACKKVIESAFEAKWIPPEYKNSSFMKLINERVLILELFKEWLVNSFYSKTSDYSNYSGFNRHHFAHAKSKIWQNPNNFFRAIGLIQILVFVENFANQVEGFSMFAPEEDERGKLFYFEVLDCINLQLIKEVNNKIIPRLEEKDWKCSSLTESIKGDGYITVKAFKNYHEINVALICTYAIDNKIYEELDKLCQFILYQEPYCKQDNFACEITSKVWPLSEWIPPE